jgi:hypothetical protein
MARYWLSFTLDSRTVGGRDYDARWAAIYEAITGMSSNWWLDTTAFAVFETDRTLDQVTTTVKGAVAPTYDLVLIRQLDNKGARIFGPFSDQDIFKLMPYLERA